MNDAIQQAPPRVVIVGAGFGGLAAAQAFGRAPVTVTLIDRTNHHLFQPLLYQVATAGLSPAEIAAPVRSVVAKHKNTTVVLDEVVGIDLGEKTLTLRAEESVGYDFLILAAGAGNNFFGHPEWEEFAPGLKNIDEAVEIRRRVLVAFEAAEREPDPVARERLLTFVVIGGGPTGVEMAGAISELSRFALARDFRRINPASTRVVLLEAGSRILASFSETLSERAVKQLNELSVSVRTKFRVTRIDARGVYFDGGEIPAATVVWAAGVRASPLAAMLGVPLDRGGRVLIEKDLSLARHPEVFAIGDMAFLVDSRGVTVPGLSPAAMQEGRTAARNIMHSLRSEPREEFRYVDKGSMATIGRSRAIAQVGRVQLSGFIAWLAWLVVHLWYLVGFRSRFVVMFSWMWSYITYKRGARLITGGRLEPGPQVQRLEAPTAAAPQPIERANPVARADQAARSASSGTQSTTG